MAYGVRELAIRAKTLDASHMAEERKRAGPRVGQMRAQRFMRSPEMTFGVDPGAALTKGFAERGLWKRPAHAGPDPDVLFEQQRRLQATDWKRIFSIPHELALLVHPQNAQALRYAEHFDRAVRTDQLSEGLKPVAKALYLERYIGAALLESLQLKFAGSVNTARATAERLEVLYGMIRTTGIAPFANPVVNAISKEVQTVLDGFNPDHEGVRRFRERLIEANAALRFSLLDDGEELTFVKQAFGRVSGGRSAPAHDGSGSEFSVKQELFERSCKQLADLNASEWGPDFQRRITPEAYVAALANTENGFEKNLLLPPFTKRKPFPEHSEPGEPGPARSEISRDHVIQALKAIPRFADAKREFKAENPGSRLLAKQYYESAYSDLIGVKYFYLSDFRDHDPGLLGALIKYGESSGLSYAQTVAALRLPPPLKQKTDDVIADAAGKTSFSEAELDALTKALNARQKRKQKAAMRNLTP